MTLENYHLYCVAIWLVTHLPLRCAYFIAGVISELNFFLNTRSRRGMYANQAHVLPPETGRWVRWRSARAAFRYFGYSLVDFFRIPGITKDNLDAFCAEFNGWENLQAAMNSGHGTILTTVHMGSWELAGVCLAMRGVPLTVVALPHKDQRIDAIYMATRKNSGLEVASVGSTMRSLYEALRRNRFIALASDRDITGQGPRLPFFGEKTHMPIGHARLALKTGAWILPAHMYRRADGGNVLEIRQPIVPDPATDTPESLALRCLVVLEDFIRARPEQWASFYNLWSTTELPMA